jgi:hypothetical protein
MNSSIITITKIPDNYRSNRTLTQIETNFNQWVEIITKVDCISMKDVCYKCNDAQVEITPTEVLSNETGLIIVPLCKKCRSFWYS